MKYVLMTLILCAGLSLAFAAPAGGWKVSDWVVKDEIGEVADGSLDICNVFCREEGGVIAIKFTTRAAIAEDEILRASLSDSKGLAMTLSRATLSGGRWDVYRGVCELSITTPRGWTSLEKLTVETGDPKQPGLSDIATVDMRTRGSLDNDVGNCAFVHHGNQGLTYTSVFRGTGSTSGFDEILSLHDTLNVPGNFHLSGTLITAAEWYDRGFDDWLRRGITEGWAAMLTSAYAQQIMPFVTNEMNNWSVHTEHELIQTKFSYDAKVAWVPERVWCSGGHYPDAGLSDSWLGDNWYQHGVRAVILDDWPHVTGYDNHKIHWMNNGSGITLRVIPIDGTFTGNVHYNPGSAIAQIQGTGRYGIVVYGTDWEAAAEMADFSCPNCLENYTQVVTWVHDNYPAVGAWKLDSALDNPDFNGQGIEITNGTYGLIGGTDGYGGSDNSWYTDWAATASHSDFHSPVWNYGNVWWQTYQTLLGAPSNNLSESGWYVMMTNLHETGWHDYMGGPVSGWEHRYSSHIKNANVYAEAAHWAAGEFTIPVNAYFADMDKDGVNELVIHNDRVMAVFESIGGRAEWVFAKGPDGYNYSVVGSDNTYWNETDGDYDEPGSNNHQAAFAEVSPNFRNELYNLSISEITDTTATIALSHGGISKTISVKSGQPYLDARYDVGTQTCYLRHGYTPDLIDMIWNADIQRVWAPDAAYAGFRDPHTGATGACVLGNGGAAQNLDFTGTLVRGDELHGYDRFGFLFYAGATSAPDTQGRIAELEALKSQNLDHYGPRVNGQAVFINANTIEVSFSESVDIASVQNPAHWDMEAFAGSYTVMAATRQADWTRVRLTVSPNLAGGDHGIIFANNVTDLVGNYVNAFADSAILAVPSGLTPHTVVIDGIKDFDLQNEILYAGTDTLVLTWDSLALYIGYWNRDLATADLFVDMDTDHLAGSGATADSWGRVRFTDPFRIEYQLAIEGGMDALQLNHWNGTAWEYVTPPAHAATSYNGWSGNPFTEIRIPWVNLGNPTGIALAVHLTAENTQQTLRAFPTSNPVGTNVLLTDFYRMYSPYVSGSMPLFGVRPKYILTGDLASPGGLVIQDLGASRRLTWNAVSGAVTYNILRSEAVGGPYSSIGTSTATQYDDTETVSGTSYFYVVKAQSGI